MIHKNKLFVLVLLLVVMLSSTGCYFWNEVESSEAGVILNDGVTVSRVVGSGRYTDMSYYADLIVIDVSTITTQWSDQSLVTKDKQPISLILELTYARSRDEADIRLQWNTYRREVRDNEALTRLVHSRVPSVAKSITTQYTLDQMLGIAEGEQAINRLVVEGELNTLLESELAEIGVDLFNVVIADIGVDDAYLNALSEKAQAQVQIEIAKTRTAQLQEQLIQEKAQTEIDLEKARRQNAMNEELARAYAENPELFELRRLELLKDVIGRGDVVIYVPEGSDIATVLSGGGIVPLQDGE